MFKLGPGGGGRGKRPLPPAPPRTAAAPGLARMPPLGGRGRAPYSRGGVVGGAPTGREERFSLLSGEIDFAAIIRLAPDLVEEIRRLEAQGGAARIKFDYNSNFTEGNVIDVGGKEFRFTWSREPGDLCDIYEERQTGEDGDGLLVERGSAWLKLNVNRVLDESTKNHVKMRSEEAERLSKARRAIVVDPTKNQVKSMAAAGVDGSMRRMNWKQKKEPLLRKGKVEPHQASNSGPSKSASKLGMFSNKSTKSVFPVSPISSPMQTAPDTSSLQKDDTFSEEIIPPLNMHKERIDVGNIGKEIPGKVVLGSKHEVIEHEGATGNRLMDLRNILLTLLSQNPKGMSLKALEKEVGETIPNAGKNIESIIKNIAIYKAPGRYVLKPGPKVENSNKGVSESAGSPESAPNHVSAFESFFGEGTTNENYKDQVQLSAKVEKESDPSNRIDSVQDIRDPVNSDKKDGNGSKGRASSSESGSASGSESNSSDSDSGSQSRSRSKSRSPVGSGSASSSDSETDGSSSSKEGSDIHVDIMTSEDEKEQAEPNSQAADLGPSLSLGMCRTTDDEQEQIDIIVRDEEVQVTSSPIDLNEFGKGDAIAHAIINVENIPIDNSVKTIEHSENQVSKHMNLDPHRADFMLPNEEISFSQDKYKQSEDHLPLHVKNLTLETNDQVVNRSSNEKKPAVNDRYGLELTEQKNKRKSKRTPVPEYFEEKPESDKRSKGARSAESIPFGKTKGAAVSRDSDYMLPDKSKQDQANINNVEWGGNQNIDSQEYGLADRGRSADCGSSQKMQQRKKSAILSRFDVEEQVTRASDFSGRKKSSDKFSKNMEGMFVPSDMTMKDKMSNNIRVENTIGEIISSIHESHKRKYVDHGGDIKDNITPSQIRKNDVNNSSLFSAQGIMLRREISDLELGEFRETSGEDIGGVKRQFERNSSFKSSDKTVTAEDHSNTDTSKGRIAALSLLNSKQSPTNWRDEVHGNQEGFYRKLQPDDSVEPARPQQRSMLSQNQSSKVDHADTEITCHPAKSAELVGQSNMRTNGMSLQKHTGSHKKTSVNMPQPDIKHDGQGGCINAKDSKSQRSNTLGDSTNWSNNSTSLDNDINGRKKRESSSDDSDSFYSTYDKEEPELRGPIKDYPQYKEYVQEYRDKYKCYISLNKNLENIRDKFLKVGEDVDFYKGRDIEEYYKIIGNLRDLYHQQGPRNKQMKKVFIVLHEELKTLKQRIQDFAQICIIP